MLRIVIGIFLIAHGLVHWVLIAPHPNIPSAGALPPIDPTSKPHPFLIDFDLLAIYWWSLRG